MTKLRYALVLVGDSGAGWRDASRRSCEAERIGPHGDDLLALQRSGEGSPATGQGHSEPPPVQRRPTQGGPLRLRPGRGAFRTHGLDARRPALSPGEAKVTLGDDTVEATPGTWVHMPTGLRHSIQAKTPGVMLLLLLKEARP